MKSLYICLLISCSLYPSDKEDTTPTPTDGGMVLAYDMTLEKVQHLDLQNKNAEKELKKILNAIVSINKTACQATFATLRQQQQTIAKLQEQNNQLNDQIGKPARKGNKYHTKRRNIKQNCKRDSVGYSADIE